MFAASTKAKEKLREQLIHKCFEVGIGYRLLFTTDECGKATFSIMLDQQRQGDEVSELDGVRAFLDPTSARKVGTSQLDYVDAPEGGFFLQVDE